MLFNEFKIKFDFEPPDYDWAERNFQMRGAALLKNMLQKARVTKNKPRWLGESVWNRLCEHWASESFKKKSAQGKLNRASNCEGFGGSLHTNGSITTSQHRANLTKLNGRPPTPLELFRYTHRRKDQTWVDKRSEHIDAEVTQAMDEATQKASQEGSSEPNEIEVWRDTTGMKKGRIYGLGLESTVVDRRPYYRGSGSHSAQWVRRGEHEELLKKMQDENGALVARLENTEKELQRTHHEVQRNNQMLQEMMRRMNFQFSDLQSPATDLAEGKKGGGDDDDDDADDEEDDD